MAVGDDAAQAGFPLVPDSGSGGEVKYGAREINRTRDFIAQLKAIVSTRTISSGTSTPANTSGANGDIYFKII